jgi:ribosomal protein L9
MRNYDLQNKWQKLLTPDIVALLTQIHEFKGEQNLFIEAHSDTLTQLVEIAKIQSTEASNKIEGIYTSDERLKKIVLDKPIKETGITEVEIKLFQEISAKVKVSIEGGK